MCLLFLTEALSELSEHYKQTASRLKLPQSHKGTEGWGGESLVWVRKVIQGSHRFLDPKFKTFSRPFPKTIISFSRLEVLK